MKYYMAYGSNPNKAQMAFRCPDAVPVGLAVLQNWELVFRRGVLTIEPKQGASVPIGIWEISDADEKSLDRYEGFPRFYRKQYFPMMLRGGDVGDVMAYIMTDGFPIQEPSFAYLRTCSQGYKDFGIDTKPLMKAYRKSKGGER